MDEFRDRLRTLIEQEQLTTTVEVTIVRQRHGRKGDAQLPVTNLRVPVRHPDVQHMEALNAHLETWVNDCPVFKADEQLDVEVFPDQEADLAERASPQRLLDALDVDDRFENKPLDQPSPKNNRPPVAKVTPRLELEIPHFVYQPLPDDPPRARSA